MQIKRNMACEIITELTGLKDCTENNNPIITGIRRYIAVLPSGNLMPSKNHWISRKVQYRKTIEQIKNAAKSFSKLFLPLKIDKKLLIKVAAKEKIINKTKILISGSIPYAEKGYENTDKTVDVKNPFSSP